MRAIVLTCDRYLPFARHMILTYQAHWPSHPFRFRIPYQRYPSRLAGDLGELVDLVPSRDARIKPTVLALLEDLPDEEWVYWCIDDKYLIALDEAGANHVLRWVVDRREAELGGVSFARCRDLQRPDAVGFNLDLSSRLTNDAGQAFIERTTYAQIWLHQFLRVAVLRDLFERFPDRDFAAKEMDALKDAHRPAPEHRLYVCAENLVVFGESTSRGKVTTNCAESFSRYGLSLPRGFELSDTHIVIGALGQAPPLGSD